MRAEREKLIQEEKERVEEVARFTDPNRRTAAQSDLKNYTFQIDAKTRQLRNIQAEVYARPALAMSCLVFALIGCPVGVWANRADYAPAPS